MKEKYTIVVDESISKDVCSRFQAFLREKGYRQLETCFISKTHPGMPDTLILHHLLNRHTIFLTTDRPLHNTILSRDLISYYVEKEAFINTKLKEIRKIAPIPFHKRDRKPRNISYRQMF